MSKFWWILFAAVIFTVCAPYAHADSITDGTFSFTVTGGSPTPTGSFVFDNTTNAFTTFTLDWDGVVYNFGPDFPAFSDLDTSGSWCAAGPNYTAPTSCAPPEAFLLDGNLELPESSTYTNDDAFAEGTYTITETTVTATPEPGTAVLLLTGLALLVGLATRKRIGHALAQSA